MGGPRTLWLLGTGRDTRTPNRRCGCICNRNTTTVGRRGHFNSLLLLVLDCQVVVTRCMPVEGRYSCCCTARPPNYQHKFAWLMGTPDEQRRGATAAAATTYTNNNNHRSSPRKTNPGLIFFAAPQNSTTRLIPDAPYFTAKTMAHILMLYG